jgi:hypothetical protein
MDETCNLRLQKHDMEIDALKLQTVEHKTAISGITTAIDDINKTLMSIRYLLMGAVGMYLLQILGLTEILKAVFKP